MNPLCLADAPIPSMDQYGLPGRWPLFLLLYHATFWLHLLFMNFALGGAIIGLVNDVRCLGRAHRAFLSDLNRRIYIALPVSVSLAITFGVAPLLFVQALYGQFFYTANILVGLPWMAVVGVLIVAFYLVYVLRFGRPRWDGRMLGLRIALSLLVALGFLYIAAMLTINHVWSINPAAWLAHYASGSVNPLPPDWQVLPRYLHNVIGATAVACLMVSVMARVLRRRGALEEIWVRRMVRGYLLAAAVLTIAQMLVGVALVLFVNRSAQRDMLATVGLLNPWGWRVGVLLSIGGLAAMIQGVRRPEQARWPWLSAALIAATLGGMELARQAVRDAYLGSYFKPAQWDSLFVRQAGALETFLVSFVVAVGLVAWLVWIAWKAGSDLGQPEDQPNRSISEPRGGGPA